MDYEAESSINLDQDVFCVPETREEINTSLLELCL